MPALHEKRDGTWCVRKNYKGCKTWQVDGKGVRWLVAQGVELRGAAGSRHVRFAIALFFEAMRLGLLALHRSREHGARMSSVRECSSCGAWSARHQRTLHSRTCGQAPGSPFGWPEEAG